MGSVIVTITHDPDAVDSGESKTIEENAGDTDVQANGSASRSSGGGCFISGLSGKY